MPVIAKPLSLLNPPPLYFTSCYQTLFGSTTPSTWCRSELLKDPNLVSLRNFPYPKSRVLSSNSLLWRSTHLTFCSTNDVSEGFTADQLSPKPGNDRIDELELLNKPSPNPISDGFASEFDGEPRDGRAVSNQKSRRPDKDEALAPFMKFFNRPRDSEEAAEEDELELGVPEGKAEAVDDEKKDKNLLVEYYDPKPGDFVVGVVISGNENKLDVNIGADLLGTMLTKEVLPLYDKEMDYLLCDLDKNAEEFMANGKLGIVNNDDALVGQTPMPSRPLVDAGTVLFAEVLGRTLSGRPLLSTRRFFRRISWHRVRQIKQLNEPFEIRITEWNTGGLLTRVEGIRAFLPKAELMKRVNSYAELKENVGRRMYVQITRINEANNDLILSQREAWEKIYLKEGTLLEGTVRKIYPYGAQIKIGETNRSGLLHISNITQGKVNSAADHLKVGEKVKALVVKSLFPNKISLSIAQIESEPGLFISNKEKVFAEAEEMAKKYRQKLTVTSATRKSEPQIDDSLLFDDEPNLYANWKWFKFQKDDKSDTE